MKGGRSSGAARPAIPSRAGQGRKPEIFVRPFEREQRPMDQQIRVLVVDDDEPHATAVAESLERVGYECVVATSGAEGLKLIEEQVFDIIITDLIMEGVGGLEVLSKAKRELPDAEVVILTGHSTIKTAVTAMQAGASTYLTKPLDINELRAVADKASQSQRLQRSNIELQRQLNEKFGFEGVIGNSVALHSVVARLRQIAPTAASVLITGESGTGKELVAKALHVNSPRRNKPFVPLNCGELSENILESELFGHVKGAFTGADRDRIGRFQYANGGTLFMDEIGDMPTPIQIKLLRVLETGEIVRVGTNDPIKVNVRLISATNRDLAGAIAEGKFRQDLYHRLKVVSIKLPPLRERRDDIPLLIEHFLKDLSTSHGKHVATITPAVRKVLMSYSWPGNVRELKNTIESMVVIDVDGRLDLDDLTEDLQSITSGERTEGAAGADSLVGKSLEEIEKHYIGVTLKLTNGNREETAKLLGIGERTLYRKLKEYQLA
jgi:two-component system response regulator HydG